MNKDFRGYRVRRNASTPGSARDRAADVCERAAELFNDALDRTRAERRAYLDDVCGDDARLRAEVESLLSAHDRAEDFLHRPPSAADTDLVADHAARAAIGSCVGRYRLVDVIASGGMGTVYRAVRADDAFEQRVAIKVIRRGMVSATMRRRFHLERQALAQLEHPYITRLIDGGTTEDGHPYLVMELVDGRPVDQYCDDRRMGVSDRLALFRRVCEAVQFAHQNLVVHRDLKPRNILVSSDGIPKLLDFGIAKLLDDGASAGDATMTLLRAMTPHYASPEQVQGAPVTTVSDVYSLGVVLYELLTGRRPYRLDGSVVYEQGRIVCEQEPPTPSLAVSRNVASGVGPAASDAVTPARIGALRGAHRVQLRRRLRGDLDNIVMMALQKNPARRYVSVAQFSEDIRRHLVGLPVVARKDTLAYRAAKLARRNKGAVAAGIALAITLGVGIVGTSSGMLKARRAESAARRERNAAVQAEAQARAVAEFLQRTMAGTNPYRTGYDARILLEMLQQAEKRIERDYVGQPAAEIAVRYAIADSYAGLWRWREAEPILRRGVALARQIYGNEHPVVADYLTLLGRALTFRMDDESIPVTREALRIRRGLFDEQSPEVAWAKTCVCFALWHGDGTRDLAEAERLAYEALAVQRPLRDTHGVDLAISLHTVAALHTFQGQPERALPVWREAIAVYRALPEFVDRYLAECIRGCALTAGYLDYGDEEVSLLREYNTLTPEAFVTDRGPRRGLWRLASVLSQRAADATGADAEALRREACDVAIRSLRGECRSLAADLPDRAGTLQRTEAALAASPGLDSVVEIVAELLGLISGDAGTGLPFRFEHAAFFADFLGDTGNGAMAIEPLQRLADTYKAVGDLQHAEACRALPSAAAKATYWTRP